MSQKTSKTLKKVKKNEIRRNFGNKIAGNSHIHIHLALFNDFLCPQSQHIYDILNKSLDTLADIEVTISNDNIESVNWLKYCIKEGTDNKLQKLIRLVSKNKFKYSVHIFNFLEPMELPINSLVNTLNKTNHNFHYIQDYKKVNLKPITYTTDEQVRITMLFAAYMHKYHYKILAGTRKIYRLIPGAKKTYQESSITLETIYNNLWESLSGTALNDLRVATSWILNGMDNFSVKLLPTIKLDPQLIEFADGVYDFKNAKFYTNHNEPFELRYQQQQQEDDFFDYKSPQEKQNKFVERLSCASFWANQNFDDILFATKALSVLQRCDRPPIDFLVQYASMVQGREHSILNLYVHGDPGAGNTYLVDKMSATVFSEENIGVS